MKTCFRALRIGLLTSTALICATATAAQDAPTGQETTVDEIVVTGIRQSIADALDTKRDADNVVDSITAQDIGKLPDQNVVDTLSRIPGVQITRSFGDGRDFTIRGISLNTVLINGRPFVGATATNSAGLDVLSSDIVGAIDVIKSPSADMIEGALGGTVDLRTKRPLSLPDGTFALRGQGQYGDLAEELGFRGSALVSGRFLDGRLGLLANLAYQEIHTEQQVYDGSNYTRVNDVDGNGDGVNDPGLFRLARLQVNQTPRTVERTTFAAALQFQPNDELDILLEATLNETETSLRPVRYQTLLNSNDVGAVANADRTVVSGLFTGVTQRPLVFDESEQNENRVFGANARWRRDRWDVSVDLSYAEGRAPVASGSTTYVVAQRAGRTVDARYNLAAGGNVTSYSLSSNFDLNDPNQYQLAAFVDAYTSADNDGFAGRFDVKYDLDWGPISSIRAGYRHDDRLFSTERRDVALQLTTAQIVARLDANRDGIVTVNELPGLTYGGLTPNDNLEGLSGQYPQSFPFGTLDVSAVRQALGYDRPGVSPSQANRVEETSNAAYVRADLQGTLFGLPFRGNAGARFISVGRESSGFIAAPGGGFQPVSYLKEYDEILPSATVVLDLTDDLLLRIAAARVIASPPPRDIAAGFTFSIVSNTGTGGNPLLDPYRADQIDASLEWYFAPSGLLSATVFAKSVQSFTQLVSAPETVPGFLNPNGTGNIFLITRPQNGSDGEIRGVEFNYQQAFTFLPEPFDGLGAQINYTRATSETPVVDELTQRTLPLPNFSENSYSLIGYYEKGPIEARVAYTFRDDYLLTTQGAAVGGSRYVDEQTSLDASITLALSPNVKVSIDGQNLLREPERRYDGVEDRLIAVLLDDRRVFFGLSATF